MFNLNEFAKQRPLNVGCLVITLAFNVATLFKTGVTPFAVACILTSTVLAIVGVVSVYLGWLHERMEKRGQIEVPV